MTYLTKYSLRLASFPEGIPTGQPRPIRYGQAFFTTELTGQGTELGLSQVEEIVMAHGGT